MPFEDTYLPLVAFGVALLSRVAHCSPAHAFHILAALAYSLAPAFLFVFAQQFSGRLAPSACAALLWSLFSPSAVFSQLRSDMGTPWGLRRLQNIVFYGETPHNVALCLLPLGLWLANRFLDRPSARRFALAALASGAVMLANAFGVVVVSVSLLMLFAARGSYSRGNFISICGILFVAYLEICRFLPPSLIGLMETNSQLVGGDYRFTFWSPMLGVSFVAVLIGLGIAVHRYCSPMVQFAALFAAGFGGITFLALHNINLLPQPGRYHIEMEAGVCLLAAFLAEPPIERWLRRLPRKLAVSCALICIVALGWVAVQDHRFARHLIHRASLDSPPFAEPRWVAANLPGERVLDATEGQWLFNLFADNPQLGAGHEPSAPNWMQRVAVYTIFSGVNAGDQDAAISILWLKAFGCGAIIVAGAESKDAYHAIARPDKFEGLLPLLWQDAGESIYRVPLRSTSLAHVIPKSAVVGRRPIHGLDVGPVRPYVAALENPAAQLANLTWRNPDEGRIISKMTPSDVLSIQVTYDPGWRASVNGKAVRVTADQLGFILIDPRCSGECAVDLVFSGGLERNMTLGISLTALAALLVMALGRPGRRVRS